jgi:hypothetical protein
MKNIILNIAGFFMITLVISFIIIGIIEVILFLCK